MFLDLTDDWTTGAHWEEEETHSHFLWAEGLGRSSGTMVSKEFKCHGGQTRFSLHFATLVGLCLLSGNIIWDSFANSLAIEYPALWPMLLIRSTISRPIIMLHARPTIWLLFHNDLPSHFLRTKLPRIELSETNKKSFCKSIIKNSMTSYLIGGKKEVKWL